MPQHSSPVERLPRPLPPSQAECCRGDCAPNCVFDVYERELERWQARHEPLDEALSPP
ncbi:MAG: oxidoreductase-like domain-containing protein [Pseudomonadota bacterium]